MKDYRNQIYFNNKKKITNKTALTQRRKSRSKIKSVTISKAPIT